MDHTLIKQLEQSRTPIQKSATKIKSRLRKNAWKFKLLAILIGVSLAVTSFYYLLKQTSTWYDEHKVTFPKPVEITLKFPIKIETRYVSPIKEGKRKEEAVKEQILISQQRATLVERIYQITRYLESEVGFNQDVTSTHLYCESIGKVNQIGYLVEGNGKFCFKDEKDQRDTFTKWFNKRLDAGMSYAEAVCLYNNGRREPMCRRSIDLNL